MARTEKGSRIKSLPPRVQLQLRDAMTGSYPMVSRFSIDGRSGSIDNWYHDGNTPIFGYYDNTQWPSCIPASYTGIDWAAKEAYELTSSVSHSGSFRKGIGDSFVDFSYHPGHIDQQALTPFKDTIDQAAIARGWDCNDIDTPKTGAANFDFYATGSKIENVGEGFSSPLWSKQKIEIDLPVNKGSTIKAYTFNSPTADAQFVSNSYRMAYYNVDNGVWEGIGDGLYLCGYYDWVNSRGFNEILEKFTCGVGTNYIIQSTGSIYSTETDTYYSFAKAIGSIKSIGNVASTFGFPFAPKYHATSSQLFKMSKYITEPFLLEKVVLDISATFDPADFADDTKFDPTAHSCGNFINCAGNTVFLMRQRRNIKTSFAANTDLISRLHYVIGNALPPPDYFIYDFITTTYSSSIYTLPTQSVITAGGPTIYIDTLRDILATHKILSCASGALEFKTINTSTGSGYDPVSLSDDKNYDTLITSSTDSTIAGTAWSKHLMLEMPCRTPTQKVGTASQPFYDITDATFNYENCYSYFAANYTNGTRNGLGLYSNSGRSLISEYVAAEKNNLIEETVMTAGPYSSTFTNDSSYTSKDGSVNPYLLLPGDELILCWHLPVEESWDTTVVTSSFVTFATGNYKLTLYGCGIGEGKEHNSTTNQLLSSLATNEVIG